MPRSYLYYADLCWIQGIVMMSALGLYINWEDEVEAALLRGEEE